MRVIIAGGGTGGHLFPAVAVGEELKRCHADTEIIHVGTTNGLEARWLPKSGLRYQLFPVHGWAGKGPVTRARALMEFLSAIESGRRLLKNFHPDLVISAGGYASAPMGVVAVLGRVPLVVLEQNTRPGMVNRLLGRFATRVCLGFEEAGFGFPKAKVVVTGNPVRFSRMPVEREIGATVQIVVLGGSSGAHRLNIGVLEAFKIRRKDVINFRVVHQTGEADVGLVADGYRQLGINGQVVPFIDDIAAVLECADLIIARSGAMTVSEIALAGRAAIFVPYPFHKDRQQEHNASVIERRGGAIIVNDDEKLGDQLAACLNELLRDPGRIADMAAKARLAGSPGAAKLIARICFEAAGQGANS